MRRRDHVYKIAKIEVHQNPFIGLYLTASDEFLLSSHYAPSRWTSVIHETLKPKKTCTVNIANSHLTGLFTIANSQCVIVPRFIEESEVKKIKHELEVNTCKIDDRFSAVKNNVVLTDKICLVNEDLPKSDQNRISDCSGVEVIPWKVNGVHMVGAVNVATNKGLLAFNNALQKEIKWLSKTFGVKPVRGTCNFGTVTTSLGITANSHGALVGSMTTGFETATIYEALSGE